jgi:hypothetical protein
MSDTLPISFKNKGGFEKTSRYLKRLETKSKSLYRTLDLDYFGRLGVDALAKATPEKTGLTASSWDYEIKRTRNGVSLYWTNKNVVNDDGELIPVVILLQYGHLTSDHRYFIQGVDFINPALAPVFEAIAKRAWREVTG